MGDDRIWEI